MIDWKFTGWLLFVPLILKQYHHHFYLFSSLKVEHLEPELQDKIKKMGGPLIDRVYFNKGLWCMWLFNNYNSCGVK